MDRESRTKSLPPVSRTASYINLRMLVSRTASCIPINKKIDNNVKIDYGRFKPETQSLWARVPVVLRTRTPLF